MNPKQTLSGERRFEPKIFFMRKLGNPTKLHEPWQLGQYLGMQHSLPTTETMLPLQFFLFSSFTVTVQPLHQAQQEMGEQVTPRSFQPNRKEVTGSYKLFNLSITSRHGMCVHAWVCVWLHQFSNNKMVNALVSKYFVPIKLKKLKRTLKKDIA